MYFGVRKGSQSAYVELPAVVERPDDEGDQRRASATMLTIV